jgi:hypothetical protein
MAQQRSRVRHRRAHVVHEGQVRRELAPCGINKLTALVDLLIGCLDEAAAIGGSREADQARGYIRHGVLARCWL